MTRQRLLAGASGYSFKEWKGNFYPQKLKPDAMLAWYSERLPTVEINHSFYRMPKAAMLEKWAEIAPADFQFSIKAPRSITHVAKLDADAVADSLAFLFETLAVLGPKRGPVLFQLPPFLEKGSVAPERVPRILAGRTSRRLRVPPRKLVQRRDPRGAETSRRLAVPLRARRRDAARPAGNRGLGVTFACGWKPIRTRSCKPGASGSLRAAGGASMLTSCTNRRHRPTPRP